MIRIPSKQELIELYGVSENAVILEPHEIFGKAITGYIINDSENTVVCYDYELLIVAQMEDFISDGMDKEEAKIEAIEWINEYTERTLLYIDSEVRPVIFYPIRFEGEK